jgi:uncharacterized membrane protein YdjX (TVP38/TMEM64 family)
MPDAQSPAHLVHRILALCALLVLMAGGAYALARGGITLETLVRHRAAIDLFVNEHRFAAAIAYIALYIACVSLCIPGATLLTIVAGFLFGVVVGAAASVVGATIGATLIFLVARTALGEPLLKRAGRRANELAHGFRKNAFSYLLFLRLVPAFPFFLVNLVPAMAGVRLLPFVAATALGVIPAALVYALAGTGLDSIIAVQESNYAACLSRGGTDCTLAFDARDLLTPQLLAALIALALLALLPVGIKRWRARRRLAG